MNANSPKSRPPLVPCAAASIRDKIRAGYPGLFLLIHEEGRAEAMLASVAEGLDYELHAWSINSDRFDVRAGTVASDEQDLMAVLAAVPRLPERCLAYPAGLSRVPSRAKSNTLP